MKKQKGFTLIELLAVIVILAIIALIATPMIMDVIDKAKKGAIENSALGYVDGVEKYSMYGMIENGGKVTLQSGLYTVANIKSKGVEYKGEEPTEGWVAVDSKGAVVAAVLKFDSYASWVGYTDKGGAKAKLSSMLYTAAELEATENPITPAAAKAKVESELGGNNSTES